MKPFQHILVPVDFGRASLRALDMAIDLAKRFDAKVTAVHAYEVPSYAYGVVPVADVAELEAAARRELGRLEAHVRARGDRIDAVVRQGPPWEVALNMVETGQVDLVVVGTHGRRGVGHALLGSVAERIVRMSPVPVLTVSQFYFEHRASAGHRLGEELASMRAEQPRVIALSRGGVALGGEVARALGAIIDVLLVEPVLARSGVVLGAVGEDGTRALDEAEIARCGVTRDELEERIAAVEAWMREHAYRLRGARWIGSLLDRTVIVPCDALTTRWRVAAFARVARALGARRVVCAVPVASREIVRAVENDVDEVRVLCMAEETLAATEIYRAGAEPSDRAARLVLHEAAAASPASAHA